MLLFLCFIILWVARWLLNDSFDFILIDLIHTSFEKTDISCIILLHFVLIIKYLLSALLNPINVCDWRNIWLIIRVNYFPISYNPSVIKVKFYLTANCSNKLGLLPIWSSHHHFIRWQVIFCCCQFNKTFAFYPVSIRLILIRIFIIFSFRKLTVFIIRLILLLSIFFPLISHLKSEDWLLLDFSEAFINEFIVIWITRYVIFLTGRCAWRNWTHITNTIIIVLLLGLKTDFLDLLEILNILQFNYKYFR